MTLSNLSCLKPVGNALFLLPLVFYSRPRLVPPQTRLTTCLSSAEPLLRSRCFLLKQYLTDTTVNTTTDISLCSSFFSPTTTKKKFSCSLTTSALQINSVVCNIPPPPILLSFPSLSCFTEQRPARKRDINRQNER